MVEVHGGVMRGEDKSCLRTRRALDTRRLDNIVSLGFGGGMFACMLAVAQSLIRGEDSHT